MIETINAKEAHFTIEHYCEWMKDDHITKEVSDDNRIVTITIYRDKLNKNSV